MTGAVRLEKRGAVAYVSFDRPASRNALTFAMYDQLEAACADLQGDQAIRTAVLRGVGGEAFAAGTEIGEFGAIATAEDGVAYEARIEAVIGALEALPFPTIAVIEGYAVGGGFAVAIACDLRVATPDAKFGYPMARTLGNCLSMANVERLVANFGPSLAKRCLLLAELIDAQSARDVHFLLEVVERDKLEMRLASLCERLAAHAPLTMRAAKEAIRRNMLRGVGEGEDLIVEVYGSRDFRTGVASFLAKERPAWTGS
jgi:enoyl-CoA hydratase